MYNAPDAAIEYPCRWGPALYFGITARRRPVRNPSAAAVPAMSSASLRRQRTHVSSSMLVPVQHLNPHRWAVVFRVSPSPRSLAVQGAYRSDPLGTLRRLSCRVHVYEQFTDRRPQQQPREECMTYVYPATRLVTSAGS